MFVIKPISFVCFSGCEHLTLRKVKFAPEQAMKAQRGSRCIALLLL
jgi:hypothetical protein